MCLRSALKDASKEPTTQREATSLGMFKTALALLYLCYEQQLSWENLHCAQIRAAAVSVSL
jgi:hypothetical protein